MKPTTPSRRAVLLALAALLAAPTAAAQDAGTFDPEVLVQVWGIAWDQDLDAQADPAGYGDPEDDPGFKIRRARLGASGELAGGISYDVVFGIASPYDAWSTADEDVGLVDGSLAWQRGGFMVRAGQQKVPYSREQLVSAGELVFTERAVSTEHMVPGRETGLVAGWGTGGFLVRGGVFNGSGSFLGDDNVGMLAALRAEYSMGDATRAYSTWGASGGTLVAGALNAYFNDDLATRTLAYGGDLLLRTGGLALLLEGHMAAIEPSATDVAAPEVLDATPRLGVLAQVGYTVGPLEPAVRASLFDDDMDVDDNGDVLEILGGLTWHGTQDLGRLGLGWVHRQELGGRSLPNDTLRLWAQVRY